MKYGGHEMKCSKMKNIGNILIKLLIGNSVLVIVAVLIILLIKGFGFGFGKGNGEGDGTGNAVETMAQNSDNIEEQEENDVLTIEVKENKYYVDDKAVTISEIKELCTNGDVKEPIFIINNYASAKEWDALKDCLGELNVSFQEK